MQTMTTDRRKLMMFGFTLLLAIALWNGLSSTDPALKEQVKQVTVAEAKALIDAGAVVIDVRGAGVGNASHIPGALLIPLDVLAVNLPKLEAYRASQMVVYCNDGAKTGPRATTLLNQSGFPQAVNLQSGIEGWRAAGLPTKSS